MMRALLTIPFAALLWLALSDDGLAKCGERFSADVCWQEINR